MATHSTRSDPTK